MNATEPNDAPPSRGASAAGGADGTPGKSVLSSDDIGRALRRMAHEIVEKNRGPESIVLVGIQRGGVWVAERLAGFIESIDSRPVPVGQIDPTFHRDDIGLRPVQAGAASRIPVPLDGAVVVLVDDVLYTGRTVRAALDAINDYGRPRAVQLAVVVDRGHRELPIRPDYVGKNLPTSSEERVRVTPESVTIHGGRQ